MPDDAAPVGSQQRVPAAVAASSPPSLSSVSTADAVTSPTSVAPSAPPPFPADTRTLSFPLAEFAVGDDAPAATKRLRLLLRNDDERAVLHVRLSTTVAWLGVSPGEVALGPGEKQTVAARVDLEKAREAVRAAGASAASSAAPISLAYQHLFPGASGATALSMPSATGTVYVRLPVAQCPACARALGEALAAGVTVPDVCPFCFERLRACPECGTPNSWLATRCVLDDAHVVRATAPWPMLGGGSGHAGDRTAGEPRVLPSLSRRWSFPSVAPSSREAALAWSAPVAAYGLVTAAAATSQGDAHLYAFDAQSGGLLWEPYPLPDPVYPERGGVSLAGGHLYAATVEGVVVCVDVLRGTRIWETALGPDHRVYGAVTCAGDGSGRAPLLVAAATSSAAGCLYALDGATGRVLWKTPLGGLPDTAPAAHGSFAYVHDDGGTLAALDLATGAVRWRTNCEANFDTAPVVDAGGVFSATRAGTVLCHDAVTGERRWQVAVTGSPFGGTPAHDGTLLYLPADDGLHLVSSGAGRAVRRYGLGRPVRSAPVVVGGTLFFGATDGRIYGAEGGGRALQTLYEAGGVGSQIVAALAWENGTVFATATNGVLYALGAASAT